MLGLPEGIEACTDSILQQAIISLRFDVFGVSCSVCIYMQSPIFGDYSYDIYIPLHDGQITLCSGQVVSDAGHSANEPGIAAELVAANEKLKNLAKNNEP